MIDLILFILQDVIPQTASLLEDKHIFGALGIAGPAGWAVHFYYMRREAKKLGEDLSKMEGEAQKYQDMWIESNKALISHGHEATGTYKPYQQ